MSEQNQNQQKEDAGKVLKQFQASLRKVTAVLNGQADPLATKRIPNGEIGEFVGKMLENRKKAVAEQFIQKLESLLNAKIEFDIMIKQKENELNQAKTAKMKEFTKLANDAFKGVENIDTLERQYSQTLNELNNGTEASDANANVTEDDSETDAE